jgi:hypothetical protein
MAFDNTGSNLYQIIRLTTFLGAADSLLKVQSQSYDTVELEDAVLASTATVAGTYNNGSSGSGATLVGTTNVQLSLDSVGVRENTRVLLKDQTSNLQNGVYTVTRPGSASTTFLLTRSTDFDSAAEATDFKKIRVFSSTSSGSTNNNKVFYTNTTGTTMGVDLSVNFYELNNSSSAANVLLYVQEFRKEVDALKVEDEFDNAQTLMQIARTTENNFPNTVNTQLSSVVSGLNSFYINQYGSNFRTYFANVYTTSPYTTSSTIWSDEFRELWRTTQVSELIVRLGSVQKSTGTWGSFVADKTIELNSSLRIKVLFDVRNISDGGGVPDDSSYIPVTLTLKRVNDNTSYQTTIQVPVGTDNGDFINITTANFTTFNQITSVSIDGYGINGNVMEFWVGL